MADLSRTAERQPPQHARSDQHFERGPARAEMDLSGPRRVRALQMTPVVVEGLMYVSAANAVWALDARTGRQVWHYSRPRTSGLVGDPASGINRGVAVLGDRVFLQTDHAHLIALHRLTGQLLWDAETATIGITTVARARRSS